MSADEQSTEPAYAGPRAVLHPQGLAGAGKALYVVAVSGVAAVGGFLFGFDSGVVNGAVDALEGAFGTGTAGTGFAVASALLGCAVGAFVAGTLADFMGRRPTMVLNAVFFLISAFGAGAAGSAGVFIASRILGGVGHRRRQCPRTDVHLGDRPRTPARPTGVAAATRDRVGLVLCLPQ
jgi:hypothetical protein